MAIKTRTLAAFAIAGAAMAGALWWAFQERPAGVDTAVVERGVMTVTLEEDGIARVRDVYRISAPVSGKLDRSLLSVGDAVKAGETVVARLAPVDPPFLDERTRAEIVAGIDAAAAAVGLAEADVLRARAALAQAVAELERAERLAKSGVVSDSQLQRARVDVQVNEAAAASAAAQVKLRESELESMKARLIEPGGMSAGSAANCCVSVHAPIDGVVLSLAVKSEQVIQAGSPLAEVGDPLDLEVAVDLVSQDAVKLKPGAPVRIYGYGGGADLAGRLRLVSPAAVTKVSALGIEEQRVAAIVDLDGPVQGLGHNFRVRAAIEEWRRDDAIMAPLSALYRTGSQWAAFRVNGDRAEHVVLEVGRMNGRVAEILSGLSAGDTVIVHPGDAIADGTLIARRAQ